MQTDLQKWHGLIPTDCKRRAWGFIQTCLTPKHVLWTILLRMLHLYPGFFPSSPVLLAHSFSSFKKVSRSLHTCDIFSPTSGHAHRTTLTGIVLNNVLHSQVPPLFILSLQQSTCQHSRNLINIKWINDEWIDEVTMKDGIKEKKRA